MSEFLRAHEVSDLTGIPVGTLRYWRSVGDKGPRSANLGGRRVVYRRSDVDAWLREQFESADPGIELAPAPATTAVTCPHCGGALRIEAVSR